MFFGLTRQEATIYIELLAGKELTGYEAAKQTGISRSNTYNALAGLVEKGAAYTTTGTSTKYTPVDPEEFCENKIRAMKDLKGKLLQEIPTRTVEPDGYITIKGRNHIFDKIKNMLEAANQRIYISTSLHLLKQIETELKTLIDRGIKVVIITNDKHYQLKDAVLYYNEKQGNSIGLIVDTTVVLTGEIWEDKDSTCLYSKNQNLVVVFKEMLRNEIKLIEIEKR